jgi:hypothetical protein
LAVVGNELLITVPEQWLADAKYPVVVDPILGTTTIGSLDKYKTGDYYDDEEDEWYEGFNSFWSNETLDLNKILITENIKTMGTFYIYKNGDLYKDRIRRSFPCMYNNVNNLPKNRISVNECQIIDPFGYEGSGWLSSDFSKNCPVNAGDYVWFGLRGSLLKMRFDFGGVYERIDVWTAYYYQGEMIPNVINESNSVFRTTEYTREMKISMYFTYEALAQNYVKTLTQGIKITDKRKIKTDYNRTATQALKVIISLSKAQTFLRKSIENAIFNDILSKARILIRKNIDNVIVNDAIIKAQTFFRKSVENARVNDILSKVQTFVRKGIEIAMVNNTLSRVQKLIRKCVGTIGLDDILSRTRLFFRKIIETIRFYDTLSKKQLISRKGIETVRLDSTFSKIQKLFRKSIETIRLDSTLSKTQKFSDRKSVV